MTTSRYTIAFRPAEFGADREYGFTKGWVILENGKRIDWPMMATREEAEAERLDMIRSLRALASDEASERRYLR